MKLNASFIALLIIFSISQSAFADVISIRADDWCSYNCEPKSKDPGYLIEIAKYIFESKGHTIEYKTMPWARAISETRRGEYIAIVGAYTDDAPDFIFTTPLGSSTMRFYGKKGHQWQYNGISSLKSIRIGVIRSYSYGEEMDQYIKGKDKTNDVQIVSTEHGLEQNIQKLLLGRIHVFAENEMVFQYQIKQKGYSINKFQDAGFISRDDVYIAFSPNSTKSSIYVEILNSGIKELRSSGKLKGILDKYGLKDWD